MPIYKIKFTIIDNNLYVAKVIANEDVTDVELTAEIEDAPEKQTWKFYEKGDNEEAMYEIIGVESTGKA